MPFFSRFFSRFHLMSYISLLYFYYAVHMIILCDSYVILMLLLCYSYDILLIITYKSRNHYVHFCTVFNYIPRKICDKGTTKNRHTQVYADFLQVFLYFLIFTSPLARSSYTSSPRGGSFVKKTERDQPHSLCNSHEVHQSVFHVRGVEYLLLSKQPQKASIHIQQ